LKAAIKQRENIKGFTLSYIRLRVAFITEPFFFSNALRRKNPLSTKKKSTASSATEKLSPLLVKKKL
jgi:hypothetical protein